MASKEEMKDAINKQIEQLQLELKAIDDLWKPAKEEISYGDDRPTNKPNK